MKKYVKKKTAVLIISYLSAAALAFGVLTGVTYERAKTYELYARMNCQHAFGEFVTAIGEMDTALQKSVYATSPAMVSTVCTEVFGKAMTAQMSLSVLPFSTQELERTSGFISRVGDYAFVLSRCAAAGRGYTDEELQNLRALSETAEVLAGNMKSLQTDLMDGVLTMDEIVKRRAGTVEAAESAPAAVSGSMQLIEKEFPEVPSLIYDGPFSEHIKTAEPKLLAGTVNVDEEQARQTASQFCGINKAKLHCEGLSSGELPCYRFNANISGGGVTVEVTQQGGKVVSMLTSRECTEGRLSAADAEKIARRFLAERGFSDMDVTYRIEQDNVISFNFAYRQGDTLCYSDLVKVAVAGDTGAVCGYEAQGYIMSHCLRDIPEANFTAGQAEEKVPEGLTVLARQKVLIPSDGKYEKACYEFKYTDDRERHCLIYVGTESGEQEKILLLIEDETGALTI